MPECEHFDSSWRVGEPVVEMVTDAGEEDATDTGQSLAACKGSQLRLSREQGEGALELFPKSVRCAAGRFSSRQRRHREPESPHEA
jgi:hypothetical protein